MIIIKKKIYFSKKGSRIKEGCKKKGRKKKERRIKKNQRGKKRKEWKSVNGNCEPTIITSTCGAFGRLNTEHAIETTTNDGVAQANYVRLVFRFSAERPFPKESNIITR